MTSEDWAPQTHNRAGLQNPSPPYQLSCPVGTLPPGWDKATEKVVGKEEGAQMGCWPHDSKASAISVPLGPSSVTSPVPSWVLPPTHTTLEPEATVSTACFCRTQTSHMEPQARLLSSLQCLENCVVVSQAQLQGPEHIL